MPQADQRDLGLAIEQRWERALRLGREARAAVVSELDPEGELQGIDRLVKRFTEVYPPDERRTYMERRLRAWWQGRTE